MPKIIIEQGECLDSIAVAHGFFWETIWLRSENGELRALRADPFVLLEGDEVFVPELERKSEACDTEKRHRFRRRGVPSQFRIQVCVGGEPLADMPFRALVDQHEHLGYTDDQGWVEFPISPDAKSGELWVDDPEGEESEYVKLNFACLDPVETVSGLQQRLENLGYAVGEEGVLDDDTAGAIAEFQKAMEVAETGEPDAEIRRLLVDEHGS